jgi:tetratricopeptide (TPR) repeat protein
MESKFKRGPTSSNFNKVNKALTLTLAAYLSFAPLHENFISKAYAENYAGSKSVTSTTSTAARVHNLQNSEVNIYQLSPAAEKEIDRIVNSCNAFERISGGCKNTKTIIKHLFRAVRYGGSFGFTESNQTLKKVLPPKTASEFFETKSGDCSDFSIFMVSAINYTAKKLGLNIKAFVVEVNRDENGLRYVPLHISVGVVGEGIDGYKYQETLRDVVEKKFGIRIDNVNVGIMLIDPVNRRMNAQYRSVRPLTDEETKAIYHHDKGVYLEQNGLLADAKKEYKEAIFYDQHNINTYVKLADLYLKEKNTDSAIKLLLEGISRNSDNYDLLFKLGEIYFQTGEYSNAEEVFKKAYKQNKSAFVVEYLEKIEALKSKNKMEKMMKENE